MCQTWQYSRRLMWKYIQKLGLILHQIPYTGKSSGYVSFKLWINPFRQFMALIFYSDYSTPIESEQNISVRFVPTWINIRRIVTINQQISVHTVISGLPLLRRRAASDIWFFGLIFFFFYDYPETARACYWLCSATESKHGMQWRLPLCRCG